MHWRIKHKTVFHTFKTTLQYSPHNISEHLVLNKIMFLSEASHMEPWGKWGSVFYLLDIPVRQWGCTLFSATWAGAAGRPLTTNGSTYSVLITLVYKTSENNPRKLPRMSAEVKMCSWCCDVHHQWPLRKSCSYNLTDAKRRGKDVFCAKFSESSLNITSLKYHRVVTKYCSTCNFLLLLTGSSVN